MNILYIHYSGYCLFHVSQFEEIGHLLKTVRSSLSDIKKFSGYVKLKCFMSLNVDEANECCSSINENQIPKTLFKFFSKCNFKSNETIGTEFSNLSKEFKDKFNLNLKTDVKVMEIIRWIRFHIVSKVKKFIDSDNDKLFLKSLSHKNVEKTTHIPLSGINITNNYNLLTNLEKNLKIKLQNLKSLIQRYFPGVAQISDSVDISLAKFFSIYLNEEITDKWVVINKDFGCEKAKELKNAIKVYGEELIHYNKCFIKSTSDEIVRFHDEIEQCKTNTFNITKQIAPNLSFLLEQTADNECDLTAAKMISKAGSLKKLSELPSATVHTLTFQDSMLRKGKFTKIPRSAKDKLHSRESKILSDKVALAARVDYFSIDSNGDYGKQLKRKADTDLKVWADARGLQCNGTTKIDTKLRIEKLKLKRKMKKKNWLKRKSDQKAKGELEVVMES